MSFAALAAQSRPEPGPADRPAASAHGLTEQQTQLVTVALEASRATSTRRAYASSWRVWETWCERNGQRPLPADPLAVASFVAERAEQGRAASTLDRDVAAIRERHERGRVPDHTGTPGVRMVMSGLRRTIGTHPRKQAHPLTTDEISDMVGAIDRTTLRGRRDAAIILLGYSVALRRSELAQLDVGDLSFRPKGVVVTIRRSKSDQEGDSVTVGAVRGVHGETCPVRAVRDWIDTAGLMRSDPLFSPITRWGHHQAAARLTGRSIGDLVISRAAAAGLGNVGVSGHSLRAGHATQAAGLGVPVERLARTTRHARLETLGAYVRPAQVLDDSSSAMLGL